MSRFLLLVCLTLGLVITGCGGEKKDAPKGTQKASDADKKGSGDKGSTDKDAGKADEKKADEAKGDEKKADEKKADEKKADDKGASVDKGGEAQLVSLKLPNMT